MVTWSVSLGIFLGERTAISVGNRSLVLAQARAPVLRASIDQGEVPEMRVIFYDTNGIPILEVDNAPHASGLVGYNVRQPLETPRYFTPSSGAGQCGIVCGLEFIPACVVGLKRAGFLILTTTVVLSHEMDRP